MTQAQKEIIDLLGDIKAAQGGGGAASFASLTGDPSDNAALDTALDAKGPVPNNTAYNQAQWEADETGSATRKAIGDKIEAVVASIPHSGYTSTATAAGIIVLTSGSNRVQRATGATGGRTYRLPSCGTLYEGYDFLFINDSSAPITVVASGGDSITVTALSAGSISIATCTSVTSDEDDESAFWSSRLISPVSDTAYGIAWESSLLAPTQNQLKDKIDAVIATIPAASSSGLLISTSVDLNAGAVSTVYEVPASRNAIITNIVMHHFSADPAAARVTFGWDASGTDLVGGEIRFDVVVSDTTTAVLFNRLSLDGVTPTGLLPNPIIGGPNGLLKINVTAEGSALTCRVDVFGYLTQTSGAPP